jgi:hypothetical protein
MSADRPSYGLSIFHGRARVESPPPGCREPSGLLPTRQWSPGTALTLWASWVPSPSGAEHHRSRRPCHPRAISSGHQRYPADNHGHFEKLDGLGSTALTWGGEDPKLHGVQGVRSVGVRAHPSVDDGVYAEGQSQSDTAVGRIV